MSSLRRDSGHIRFAPRRLTRCPHGHMQYQGAGARRPAIPPQVGSTYTARSTRGAAERKRMRGRKVGCCLRGDQSVEVALTARRTNDGTGWRSS